jgi:hypothetical protein
VRGAVKDGAVMAVENKPLWRWNVLRMALECPCARE